jgi:hypothetical protein
MFAVLHALGMFVSDIFKSRRWLQAENLFLRHQLNIALRRAPVLSENAIRKSLHAALPINFPVLAYKFPVLSQKFPVLQIREF